MKTRVSLVRLAVLPLACAAAFPAQSQTARVLPETVVTATRSQLPVTDVVADVSIIDRAQIERSGANGLADVLSRVPGVTVTRNGGPASTTSLYLRGGETRFTAVFVDGVRVDSQSTGGAAWGAIPLSQVERIEVLRGPAAAVYGSDALAGVVQIFTRQGEAGFFPSVHLGVGTHNTRDASVSLRGGQGAVSYALGVAGERSDGFNAQPKGNPDRDGYRSRSMSGRLGWTLAPGQVLEATLLDSAQRAGFDGFLSSDDDQAQQDLRTLGLNWSSTWSEAWSTRPGGDPRQRPLRDHALALPDRNPH